MRPAVGGLLTGVLAAVALYFLNTEGVTGGGYSTLSQALSGSLPLKVMAALCFLKLGATVFSYSSGGAGGIFAPSLFVGGMLGGVAGFLDVNLFHHPQNGIGAFALVGMGAVFAGVVRAPITSVLIIFEMTGSYGLILPLMIANMTSYAIAKHYRGTPIYEALLVQDNIHLPHRTKPAPHELEKLTVAEAMTPDPTVIDAELSLDSALEKVRTLNFPVLPVVEQDGRCVGLITRARLERNIAEKSAALTVGEVTSPATFAYPDWTLSHAIVEMNHARVIKLCVVERNSHHKLVGILTMSDIVRVQAEILDQKENPDWSAVPNASETVQVTPNSTRR
jgi:CIC family chloride channel protein